MAKRYIGDAVVTITYHDAGDYRGTVSAKGYSWRFDELRAPAMGLGAGVAYDSPEAYDKMAASAVSFGGYYTTHNRGDAPDWAPPAEVADAISDATAWATDAEGQGLYYVQRSRGVGKGRFRENAGRPQRKKHKPLPKWLNDQIREADQAVQEAEDELGEAENSGYQERIRDAEEAVETAYEDRDQLWDQAEKWEDTHAALLSNPTGGQVAAVAVGAAILAAAAWWLFKPKMAQAATPICFNNESGLRECYSPPLSDAAKTRLQQIYPNASPELKAAIDAALKQSPSTTYGVDPASMFMI